MPFFNVDKLSISFGGLKALQDISFEVNKGEIFAIIGPNGAGKSTLLRLIGGLLEPSAGEIALNSVPIRSLSFDERAKTISFVFQENYTGFPFTVYEVVLLGRHPRQDSFLFDSDEDRAIADEMLYLLGIYQFRHRLFRTLSGGEKQRVAIARSLVTGPDVIFADEPTGNLDSHSGVAVMQALQTLNDNGHTIILVTHERATAEHAKRILHIKDGRIDADTTDFQRSIAMEGLSIK